jgi:hypothetical protein
MHPARPVIHEMSGNNKDHGKRQDPVLVTMPELFHKQKHNAGREYKKREQFMVMFFITMPEGVPAYQKSKHYHKIFKTNIIYNVYSKNRETLQ